MDPDPLLIEAPLELVGEFHPLGFPLRLATNSAEVAAAAWAGWGHFPAAFQAPPIHVEVLVEAGGEPPEPPVFRARRHLIVIGAGANYAVCDHTRRFAFCRLSAAAAGDAAFLRYYFLEAIALFTLTQLEVTPVHGAAIARGGRALLLCGESGAGKSTLAYAAARRGWTYISDNETWLLRADARTILGNPAQIRMRESAAALFPELAARPAIVFNGKRSILLDSAGMDTAFQCRPERILFLRRTPEPARMARSVAAAEAAARLLSGIIHYSPEVREAHRASLAQFTRIPAMDFEYRDPDDALAKLEGLLG